MEKNIKIYTLSTLAFLCILSLSGSVQGILGEVLYFLAFIIPTIIPLLASKDKIRSSYLTLKPENISLVIYAAPFILFSVFALSYLTAFLIYITAGAENPPQTNASLLPDLLELAVAPAIFEEALFRYLPLVLISTYSKKAAVIISSLYFALVHLSLFSIPYAFFAGIAFILADIITGSILPSVILHFVNNLISILWEYSQRAGTEHIFLAVFCTIALISLILIIIMKKKYISAVRAAFDRSDKCKLPPTTLALIIPTAIIAILNLFY